MIDTSLPISRCLGGIYEPFCPLREKCYRYTASDDKWQSYIAEEYNMKTKSCEYFWENKNGKEESNRVG